MISLVYLLGFLMHAGRGMLFAECSLTASWLQVGFLVELQLLALRKLKQSRLEVEKHHSLIHFEGQ